MDIVCVLWIDRRFTIYFSHFFLRHIICHNHTLILTQRILGYSEIDLSIECMSYCVTTVKVFIGSGKKFHKINSTIISSLFKLQFIGTLFTSGSNGAALHSISLVVVVVVVTPSGAKEWMASNRFHKMNRDRWHWKILFSFRHHQRCHSCNPIYCLVLHVLLLFFKQTFHYSKLLNYAGITLL